MVLRSLEEGNENGYTAHVGDFAITFPDIVPLDISRKDFRTKILDLFRGINNNRYTPNKLPLELRSGDKPITTPQDLAHVLTPSGQYLAENIPSEAKERVQKLSEAVFTESRHPPLNLHIYPGSVNIPQALADLPNQATLLDHLFMRQVTDIIKPLGNSQNQVEPLIIDDTLADQWVFNGIIPADILRKAQGEHTIGVGNLSSLPTKRVEEIFPTLEIKLDETLKHLEDILQQSSRLSDLFLAEKKASSWSQHRAKRKFPPPQGAGWFDEDEQSFVEAAQETFKTSPLKFLHLPTTWQFYKFASMLGHQFPSSPNIPVYNTGEQLTQNQVNIAKRLLARELTYNSIYAEQTKLLPRIVPGEPRYYKKFLQRFAVAIKPSGHDFGNIPQLTLPGIIVPFTVQKGELSNHQNARIQPDLSVGVRLGKKQYKIPVNTGGRGFI